MTMACPYFYPVEKLAGAPRGIAPLGDLYNGECRAAEPVAAPGDLLRDFCNMGYAAGRCPRFPPGGA
ncbi:MAG: hypothetical protein ACRD96_11740, partial [Bryobacteraceae bacterium]